MEKRVAFCSACDRNVPVVVLRGVWEQRPPSRRDAEEAIVCLDYGVRCTGSLCPMYRIDAGTEDGVALRGVDAPPEVAP
jgi:hypothetical protein